MESMDALEQCRAQLQKHQRNKENLMSHIAGTVTNFSSKKLGDEDNAVASVKELMAPQGPGNVNMGTRRTIKRAAKDPESASQHLASSSISELASKEPLGEGTADTKDHKKDCTFGKIGCLGGGIRPWVKSFTNKAQLFLGDEVVSKRCKDLGKAACTNTLGCSWDGSCIDGTTMECAANKKMISCTSRYKEGPRSMSVHFDQLCGKLVLGQKMTYKKACGLGLRSNMECTVDSQCGPPDVKSRCNERLAYEGCMNKAYNLCDVKNLMTPALMNT